MPDLTINGEAVSPEEAARRLAESVTLAEAEAVGRHSTATDTSSEWDGPQAVADAPEDGDVLRYMHAAFRGGDRDVKQNWALPHHRPGTDTAANIAGVNNALARLSQTQGIDGARDGAEQHLRGHRADAGLEETMSEAEARQAARAAELSESAVVAAETGRLTESGALREASVESGRAAIRIIEAGQGSSGLYPEDTLREAASGRVFAAGTPMFVDHPTSSEGYERPERSVRDLAGRLTEDAWFADGALVAEAEIFPHWRDVIAGMAEHIGVSIRADGRIDESGTVTEITRARSVDYVTEAGAGGRVDELIESARHAQEARNTADWIEVEIHRGVMGLVNAMWGEGGSLSRDEWQAVNDAVSDAMAAFRGRIAADVPDLLTRDPVGQADMPMESTTTDAPQGPTREEGRAMSETTAPADGAQTEHEGVSDAQFQEAIAARDQRIEALERQIAEQRARDTVDRIVREATDLPEQARQRAAQAVDLSGDDLAEATRQALDAERAYVAEVRRQLGVGRVSGMGETQSADSGPRTVEDYQRLGLSEADAKAAARIHA